MEELIRFIRENYPAEGEQLISYLPKHPIDTGGIQCVMISEVAASNPKEDFYGEELEAPYLQNALALFQKAGLKVNTMKELNQRGIYITNAVKSPKEETTIPKEIVQKYVPLLSKELELFPNLKVVMLMGDVARKAFNFIAKSQTGKNALPPGATYKIRHDVWVCQGIRLLPAYIMTGKNLLIEKSKVDMSVEEIKKMLEIIQ